MRRNFRCMNMAHQHSSREEERICTAPKMLAALEYDMDRLINAARATLRSDTTDSLHSKHLDKLNKIIKELS